MLIQLFRAHVGKKTSVSCETITSISYISRMLTNRMISIKSGSCFATQQLRLWNTSISWSRPTAYWFWVLRDKNRKWRPFFVSHKFLQVSCLIFTLRRCGTSFLLPLRTTWYDTRFNSRFKANMWHITRVWVTSKLCDFTGTNELESLDRMHKSVIAD